MTDFIINNPIALRGCILYEFLKGREPFKTYQKLMERLGDDFMNYPEFEFWFMRFSQGNFDLDYDFSLEPEKRQITDLPVDVFEKIGDYLYFKDRIQLRLVSKDIQLLVDEWNPRVTEFTYSYDEWYITHNSGVCGFWEYMKANQLGVAVRILKNPKLRLKQLRVRQDEKWIKIEEELRKSSTKLHVVNLILLDRDYPIDFNLFAPKSLEEVAISIKKSVKQMDEIVTPEQCKQLKMLKICTQPRSSLFSVDSLYGYPRFTITFYERDAEIKVTEFVKKLVTSTQLELCNLIHYRLNLLELKQLLNEKDTMVPDCPNIRRYPIQGSTDFHEINIKRTSISIERKS